MPRKALGVVKRFLKNEEGDTVNWFIVMLVGIILAVIIWQNLAPGIKNAAESMNDALSGN